MTSRDIIANEKNYLGCLLRSPHEFWQTSDRVSEEMFTVSHHRDIYGAVSTIMLGGRQVSRETLLAHLPAEYEDAGPTIGILATLKENAIDAGSSLDYAPFLTEQSAARKLASLADYIRTEAKKQSPDDLAADVALRLQEIMASASPIRPRHIGEAAERVARHAGNANSGEVSSGLDTGIPSLDAILGLILGGDLGAIIASQADGKSALAAQIAMHAAGAGRPVLYFQMELSDEQMAARELAAASGIPVNQIHEGAFDAFQFEQIAEAERALRRLPFHIVDVDEITVRQMKAMANAMQRNTGLSLIVIDQLDKIKAEGKYRDRFEKTAEITRDLKKMAKALKVPVIVLAQRTRSAQRRDDPTPDILDADAPSLERDCDWILGLWRRENWLRRNKPDGRRDDETDKWVADMHKSKGVAEIICLKRRRGKAFEQCKLEFIGERMRFEEQG